MRRESGVEDDGVLFISPSVSTLPLELEAQTETVLINYPLPNGLAYSETEQGREEGEPQWKKWQ